MLERQEVEQGDRRPVCGGPGAHGWSSEPNDFPAVSPPSSHRLNLMRLFE